MVANKVELPLRGGGGGSTGGIYVRSDRNTQFGFSSVADLAPSSGEEMFTNSKQWPNGSAAGRSLFGRWFESRSGAHGGGAADGSRLASIRTANRKNCSWLCYHSTVSSYDRNVHPHCLEPSEYKLLYHALAYATQMTPKKGGYTTPAPALDLTTSLQGDWYFTKGSVTGAPLPDPPPSFGGLPRLPPPAQANFPLPQGGGGGVELVLLRTTPQLFVKKSGGGGVSGPLCAPGQTNCGPAHHTTGTAIFQNWGVRIQGPGPAPPPPPAPRAWQRLSGALTRDTPPRARASCPPSWTQKGRSPLCPRRACPHMTFAASSAHCMTICYTPPTSRRGTASNVVVWNE